MQKRIRTPTTHIPALALAAAIADGELSAAEAIDAHLARIDAVNPQVNAVTTSLAEDARAAAAELDRRHAAGEPLGPLAGVPFTVKENIHVAGSATTFGVPALRGLVAPDDAPPVRRLRAAGAIPIGRTNLPDMTIAGMHTTSTLYGDTLNPWDRERTPGGSSGGDAVAVATGMAPLGLGNDSGGSLAIPAAFNGVAALKPSTSRIAMDHRLGGQEPTLSSQLFPVDGPIARTVADLRAVLATLAGPDSADPRAVPAPLDGPSLPTPIRVGLVTDPAGPSVDPAVRAGVEAAAAALEDAGYVVEPIDAPRIDDAIEAYHGLVFTEFALVWPALSGLLGEDGRRHVEHTLAAHPPADLPTYVALTAQRIGVQRAWAQQLIATPLMLGPVSTALPPRPAEMHASIEANARTMDSVRLCRAVTLVGAPAVTVPTGLHDDRLPLGVQVIGSPFREDLCLDAAAAIEQRLGVPTPIDP